jgi:AcrR family transcriptional regulator
MTGQDPGTAWGGEGRPAPNRDRRLPADERREILLDAADTVIRRVGVRVSAELIAREAGVTKPIIYRHFGDIQELYRSLADRHEQRLFDWLIQARNSAADLDRFSRFRSVVEAFFEAVDREPDVFRFLVYAGGDAADQSVALSWFTRRWANRIAAHLVNEAVALEGSQRARAMGFAMAGALQIAASWWLEERTGPRSEIIDAISELLIKGMPPEAHSHEIPELSPDG